MPTIRLRASDGHELDAYLAEPAGTPRGGLVIGQEMYGVTDYLRGVCDDFATLGYAAIAPALYDRSRRGLTFGYTADGHDHAQRAYRAMELEPSIADFEAARDAVARDGPVGVLGFCWGGSVAWLSATRGDFAAAIVYYGPRMLEFVDEAPRCPVVAHVGSEDPAFPPDRLDAFRAARPEVEVHLYSGARHGFDNPGRPERHHAEAHRVARERSLEFLRRHVG